MRAYLPKYNLMAAKNLHQALQIINSQVRPIAGGTDLMVLFESGKLPGGDYVNIWGIEDLCGIIVEDERIIIRALTTYGELRKHPIIQKEFPCLVDAAKVTGGIAIQNRGTIGGNIANASPAADSPPALLVYEAKIKVVSSEEERLIDYQDFHLGYKKMQLKDNELIKEIHLPRKKYAVHYYRKVGTRKAQAISKICMAATINKTDTLIDEIKIAIASVAPTVIRCKKTEKYLQQKNYNPMILENAQNILKEEIAAITDIRSTKEYRTRVSCNLLKELLNLTTEEK